MSLKTGNEITKLKSENRIKQSNDNITMLVFVEQANKLGFERLTTHAKRVLKNNESKKK
jgi:hypothetical protein